MKREIRCARPSRSAWLALGACVLIGGACAPTADDRGAGVTTEGDWAVITGNLAGQRYTELTQINPSSFSDLELAWPGRRRRVRREWDPSL